MPVSVPSRARVFISYKRHVQPDESLALALYQVLSVQHDVFLDQKTLVGTRWGQHIDTALEQTDFLLVLLSAEAVCSEMVLEEVKKVHYRAKAQAGQPIILPIRLAYDDALPYPLSAYVDFITTAFWSGPDDTLRLTAQLLQAIAGTPLHPGPLSPPVRPAAEEPALQPPLTGNEPASPVFGAFSLAAAQPPNVLATTLRRLRQRLARSWRRLGSGAGRAGVRRIRCAGPGSRRDADTRRDRAGLESWPVYTTVWSDAFSASRPTDHAPDSRARATTLGPASAVSWATAV